MSLDRDQQCRGPDKDAALAGRETGLRLDFTAAVIEQLGLLPFGQCRYMANHERIVDREFGVQAAKAVRLSSDRYVVEGREVLDVDPGRPVRGEAAGDTGFAQLACRGLDFGPRLRRLVVVEPRGVEKIIVKVKDRGR